MLVDPKLDFYVLQYFYSQGLIAKEELLNKYVKELGFLTLTDYTLITGEKAMV